MFDSFEHFKHLNRRTLSVSEFKLELRKILMKNVQLLLADTTVKDLWTLAVRRRWVTELPNQQVVIDVRDEC